MDDIDVTGYVDFSKLLSASDSTDDEIVTRIVEWTRTINFKADADRLLRLLGYDVNKERREQAAYRVQSWLDTRRTSRRSN